MLVFNDPPTGYLVLEVAAEDRTYTTWEALVDERLKALGVRVRYLVSDCAKALIQLEEQGFECLRMPDFFHSVPDLVKSCSLAMAQGVRHAQQEPQLPAQALGHWRAWALQQVHAFQRASSAAKGRNAVVAQLHHNQRGLPKQRYKVWTALHNFDCRVVDGTRPASRFFKRTFSDLFEAVLYRVNDLPRPRQRQHQVALTY